ncbi:MAG: Lar family restriction alleviation protein [Pelagimonas sp.]|uniref:Lar family restriction alleviation protein n=1 Tax=Pelagimonas sp. TaxID=2073170 RepID=UPI003D6B2942
MDKLKPCPFCGPNGTPIVRDCFDHFIAECGTCGCMQAALTKPSGTPRFDVIAAWNTRATPTVQEAAKVLLGDEVAFRTMATAARRSRAEDAEGTFPPLFALLDFSGENKTKTVVDAAIHAALRALAQEGE